MGNFEILAFWSANYELLLRWSWLISLTNTSQRKVVANKKIDRLGLSKVRIPCYSTHPASTRGLRAKTERYENSPFPSAVRLWTTYNALDTQLNLLNSSVFLFSLPTKGILKRAKMWQRWDWNCRPPPFDARWRWFSYRTVLKSIQTRKLASLACRHWRRAPTPTSFPPSIYPNIALWLQMAVTPTRLRRSNRENWLVMKASLALVNEKQFYFTNNFGDSQIILPTHIPLVPLQSRSASPPILNSFWRSSLLTVYRKEYDLNHPV